MSFVFSSRITSKEEDDEEEEERKQTPLAKKKFENTTHEQIAPGKFIVGGKRYKHVHWLAIIGANLDCFTI